MDAWAILLGILSRFTGSKIFVTSWKHDIFLNEDHVTKIFEAFSIISWSPWLTENMVHFLSFEKSRAECRRRPWLAYVYRDDIPKPFYFEKHAMLCRISKQVRVRKWFNLQLFFFPRLHIFTVPQEFEKFKYIKIIYGLPIFLRYKRKITLVDLSYNVGI